MTVTHDRKDRGVLTMVGALEPRSGWVATNCPVAAALEVVGTRSAILILREAFYGATRFDEFSQLVGLSDASTAARLAELVDAGLLERRPYKEEGSRTRMGYHLTEMGADFFPAFVALMQWGDRWLGPSRVELRHEGCGSAVGAQVRCAQGHPVSIGTTELAPRRGRRPARPQGAYPGSAGTVASREPSRAE